MISAVFFFLQSRTWRFSQRLVISYWKLNYHEITKRWLKRTILVVGAHQGNMHREPGREGFLTKERAVSTWLQLWKTTRANSATETSRGFLIYEKNASSFIIYGLWLYSAILDLTGFMDGKTLLFKHVMSSLIHSFLLFQLPTHPFLHQWYPLLTDPPPVPSYELPPRYSTYLDTGVNWKLGRAMLLLHVSKRKGSSF